MRKGPCRWFSFWGSGLACCVPVESKFETFIKKCFLWTWSRLDLECRLRLSIILTLQSGLSPMFCIGTKQIYFLTVKTYVICCSKNVTFYLSNTCAGQWNFLPFISMFYQYKSERQVLMHYMKAAHRRSTSCRNVIYNLYS